MRANDITNQVKTFEKPTSYDFKRIKLRKLLKKESTGIGLLTAALPPNPTFLGRLCPMSFYDQTCMCTIPVAESKDIFEVQEKSLFEAHLKSSKLLVSRQEEGEE